MSFSMKILEEAMQRALTLCDVVVCSGGVSMGEKVFLSENFM